MGFSKQEYWSGVPLPSLWMTLDVSIGRPRYLSPCRGSCISLVIPYGTLLRWVFYTFFWWETLEVLSNLPMVTYLISARGWNSVIYLFVPLYFSIINLDSGQKNSEFKKNYGSRRSLVWFWINFKLKFQWDRKIGRSITEATNQIIFWRRNVGYNLY